VGAILYEFLTSRPPFRGETPLETLLQVQEDQPVSPSRLQPRLSRDLATVCLKCLQKEPRKRYPSALALADDLGRWLRGESIRARPVSRGERLWRWGRRNPAVAALSAAVLLLAVGGFAGILWKWLEAEEQSRLTKAALDQQQITLYFQTIALAERELSANNFGRAEELLDRCPEHLRGWEWHYLKRLSRGNLLASRVPPVMAFHGDNVFYIDLVFRPGDGSLLAAPSGVEVKVWDASTGQEIRTLKGHTDTVSKVVFSPTGSSSPRPATTKR
jgi:serine/threonine protein kinase